MKHIFFGLMFAFSTGAFASGSAPAYCIGVSQEDSTKEIELILNDGFYEAGYTLQIDKIVDRMGGSTYSGSIIGLVFAGGGSASWKMDLALTAQAQRSGVLTLSFYSSHDAINSGSGYSEEKYDVVCE